MKLHLDKRSNTWGIRFSREEKPPHGKRVSLRRFAKHSVYDKSEAEEHFDIIKKKWLEGKLRELDQGKQISLEKLGDKFVDARPDLSEDTHRMDRLSLQSLGDVIGASKGVRSITKGDLNKFKKTCLARGLSPFTVKAYFRHIKAALNWAFDEDYLKKLPKFPKVKTPKRPPAAIPREDRRLIEDWAFKNHPRLWRYIRFALWTGCRRAECLSLRAEKVKLYHCPNGPVVGWATVIGKGDKEREVPLLIPTLEALDPLANIGPVFEQVHPDTISKWFRKAVVALGLQAKKYKYHGLRHSAASEMLDRGVNIKYVQEILGHEDIRTTMGYLEANKRSIEDDLKKMA